MKLPLALILLFGLIDPAVAATLPTGFVEAVLGSTDTPSAINAHPDGRVFVCQQRGALRVFKNGALLPAPFLSVTVNSAGERGLLGVAFHPDFANQPYVYVYYTAPSPSIHNRLSRFRANGDIAVPGSEQVLMDFETLGSATFHNGGALHFGPDGKLYVAVGENTVGSNAQTLNNRLGKILRLNPDGSIPNDNPFYASATGLNRSIWALGLRNPFTFNFNPGNGLMHINDVGGNTWEEINLGVAGSNYGWPNTEGPTSNPAYRSPLYSYGHSGGACAIVGAAFYRASSMPFPAQYHDNYFFADYCAGWIRTRNAQSGTVSTFASGAGAMVDLAVGPSDGALYYATRAGELRRISYPLQQAPAILTQPSSLTVAAGAPASFQSSASGAAPLSWRWQRNGVDIPSATAASYTLTLTALTDSGASFRAVVCNSLGCATSQAATLFVTANQAPQPSIALPGAAATYRGGDLIAFAGSGTDPEDGILPAAAFTWWADFHHHTHTHPLLAPISGVKQGSFEMPFVGETSEDVWIRLYLRTTDTGGQASTVYRDIQPELTALRLESDPPGLSLTLDGQPQSAPIDVVGVVGMQRELGAPSPQTLGGVVYTFSHWSDGGARVHFIRAGASTPYVANFVVQPTATPSATPSPTPTPVAQGPYGPLPGLPAILQAEQYDVGGASVAFSDSTPLNQGGAYRTDAVDIQATTDSGGGFNVGWTENGEWLEYTVSSPGGTYDALLRVASNMADPGDVRLFVDGALQGTFNVVGTGGWQSWATVRLANLTLAAGSAKVIRLEIVNGSGINLNWLQFVQATSATATATPSVTTSATRSATSSSTPSATASMSPSTTPSVTASATASSTPDTEPPATTPSATPSATPTDSLAVATASPSPSATPTRTVSATVSMTRTVTRTSTPSATRSATASMPAASLRVDYKPATVARFATGLQPRLRLLNTGISSVALANTEIRYWFAQEGGGTHLADLYDVRIMPSGQSVIGTCSAKVVPDAQGGQSHVLKLSFGPAAGGLPAGSYVEFQLQVHTSNWSTYDQANDYSYAAWPEVRPQPMVAAYFGGTLVWGSEPGAGSTTRVSLARPEPDDKKGVGVPEAERILSAVSIPNPATTGTLTLAYQSDGKAEQVLLELFSAGQVQVARSEWPGPSDAGWHRTTMDLSGLPNGAYTARLRLRSGAGLSRPYATTVIILR